MAYEVRRDRIEPLWDRVDRNKIQLVAFLALFFVAATLTLSILAVVAVAIAAVIVFVAALESGLWIPGEGLATAAIAIVACSAIGVVVYMLWSLARDERWFARRLGATLVPTGEALPTKYALKDMAIASGYDVAPALYVIETLNVNAFAYQRGSRRAIVGVTRGLMERLDPDEQRGVFANLMARLQQGDMLWASAVTALMSPMWRLRDRSLTADEEILFGESRSARREREKQHGGRALDASEANFNPFFALVVLWVVVSEFLTFGHRRSQLRHAELADAEGMLLLKEPRSMLAALEKAVRCNNFVPTAGPGMSQLFYCWTGEGSTDDENDPEARRVTRLREVLGVEGMEPPDVASNEATFVVAPSAPRLEE